MDEQKKTVSFQELEKALRVPVTSEDERIELAEKLGNKNQRKLRWIREKGFVLLKGGLEIDKIMDHLLENKNEIFYKCLFPLEDYALPIPMSTLSIAEEALKNGFSKEDLQICDKSFATKDPVLIAFVSKELQWVGAVISRWE